ncbi:MAG: hypothetical protein ABSG13_16765 [Bryobacteraceae bacterium]|jgi:hypothetical protein
MLKALSIVAALIGVAAALCAQTTPYPDTFKVNYYSNANTTDYPSATVRITNVGTQIGAAGDASGNLCAMIYVFSPDQELDECCGCSLTPDGLITLDVNVDLTSNPLTAITLYSGAIKIVSSTGSPACNPTKPAPVSGVRAWATHIQSDVSGGNCDGPSSGATFQTETEFSDSNLSAGELSSLKSKCAAIINTGSGHGICTCGTGD